MKTIFSLLPLIIVSFLFQDMAQATPLNECVDHHAWLQSCLDELKSVQPGSTRKEVLQVASFTEGMNSGNEMTLMSSKCPLILILADFKPCLPKDDPHSFLNENDTILSLSKPWLGTRGRFLLPEPGATDGYAWLYNHYMKIREFQPGVTRGAFLRFFRPLEGTNPQEGWYLYVPEPLIRVKASFQCRPDSRGCLSPDDRDLLQTVSVPFLATGGEPPTAGVDHGAWLKSCVEEIGRLPVHCTREDLMRVWRYAGPSLSDHRAELCLRKCPQIRTTVRLWPRSRVDGPGFCARLDDAAEGFSTLRLEPADPSLRSEWAGNSQVEWVEEQLKQIASIHPGTTREELLRLFRPAGRQTPEGELFCYRACPVIQVKVSFSAPQKDADGRLAAAASDTVAHVSQPELVGTVPQT